MAIITGTPGDDNVFVGGNDLNGTSGDDDIFGLAGNDRLLGREGNDFLLGGAGNDGLFGFEGNDFLLGGEGNDTLTGITGNDIIVGGAGNDFLVDTFENDSDQLIGGDGNDTYAIDFISEGDLLIEAVNGGIDTVEINFNQIGNFTLGANLENLNLENNVLVNGTGNELNNTITGSSSSNILGGLAGNDSLIGENGNDVLFGGNGNDTLTGGFENDRLLGDAGADRFRFLASNEFGSDTIADFVAVDDAIQVSAAGFGGGLTAGSAISAGQFRLGFSAQDANDRFIYGVFGNGFLSFDPDGTGPAAQVQIATLIGAPTLSAADIVVI